MNGNYGSPSNYLHGIAVAPYFDLGDSKSWTNLTTDDVLDGLNTSIDKFLPEFGWNERAPLGVQSVYASWFNLSVYGYEGGSDLSTGCDQRSLEAKRNATRHHRMTDLCLRLLNG